MKKLFVFIFFICLSSISFSREVDELTYDEFIALLLTGHPLAQKADLQLDFAEAQLLEARGSIDPKIKMNFDNKSFDDKNYYQLFKSEIKVPTVLGLNVKANFENNNGEFLNPANNITNNGLYAVGVEMDVLRNWSYNDRKAAFDQANVFENVTVNEQRRMLNHLVLDASNEYVSWWNASEKLSIIEENLELAEKYLENTRQSVLLGDKPAIDTIEASTILLDQLVSFQELQLETIKAKFKVNNYLWENNQMVFMREGVTPTEPMLLNQTEQITVDYFATHPEVQSKQLKVDQLDITNRLAKQQLLPEVNLGYFPLISTNENTALPADTQIANYKIGARFSMPLFRRKEKAKLLMGQLKVQETEFELLDKQNELFIKWNIEQNNIDNYEQQLSLVNQAQENYQALIDAELLRYDYGESSVFLVNKRLEKLLESQMKLQELRKKIYNANFEKLYLQNDLIE